MVYRAACGLAEGFVGLRVPQGSSLSGLSVRTGTTLRCDDSEVDDRVDRAACRRIGLRSMLVVPLFHAGLSIGVLKVLSAAPGSFDDADAEVLSLMGTVIAASMQHATDFEVRSRQAFRDELTGLANRAAFGPLVTDAVARSVRRREPLGIVFLDLNGFKAINDELGHDAGDDLLRLVASRLTGAVRETDVVARLGGDEFVILCEAIGSREDAERLLERLTSAIAAPAVVAGRDVSPRASIGLVYDTSFERSPEDLVADADRAMYRAKRERVPFVLAA
jgi:diguanylate cyclase (GGDEF)-like protein